MRLDPSMKLKINKMIQNLDKIKGMEFNFPIKNAKKAMYKIESVNELNNKLTTIQMYGDWAAVILAKADKSLGYMIPEHVVFTVEYDRQAPMSTFKITAITSDNEQSKIDVSKNALKTPESFFETLKSMAEHSVIFNP